MKVEITARVVYSTVRIKSTFTTTLHYVGQQSILRVRLLCVKLHYGTWEQYDFFLLATATVYRKLITGSQLDAQNIPIKPIRHHTVPDTTQTTSIKSIQLKLCSKREIGHFYIVVVQ